MNKIEFNLQKGDSVKISADNVLMVGIEQNIAGGQFECRATTELVQTNNKIKVTDGGEIINDVTGGSIKQTDNSIDADEQSNIVNKL